MLLVMHPEQMSKARVLRAVKTMLLVINWEHASRSRVLKLMQLASQPK